mmetsp:Transcript_4417/g.13385  ORF Transcript_4417/g.13385 Transcript_4417/m.13385 type:complete len:202 (+) Transcript_4417:3006-3611(+)
MFRVTSPTPLATAGPMPWQIWSNMFRNMSDSSITPLTQSVFSLSTWSPVRLTYGFIPWSLEKDDKIFSRRSNLRPKTWDTTVVRCSRIIWMSPSVRPYTFSAMWALLTSTTSSPALQHRHSKSSKNPKTTSSRPLRSTSSRVVLGQLKSWTVSLVRKFLCMLRPPRCPPLSSLTAESISTSQTLPYPTTMHSVNTRLNRSS